MPILAISDVQGNIQQIVVSPADAPFATVTAETGPSVTSEIEVSGFLSEVDLSNLEGSLRQVSELTQHLQDFRIEVGVKARLIQK
jgi:hypothetical protein